MTGHWWDLLPLVLLALLIFGPKRLPEMGASIGKTIKSFQHSMREVGAESETQPTPPASALTTTPQLPSAPATPSEAQTTTAPETVSAESAS